MDCVAQRLATRPRFIRVRRFRYRERASGRLTEALREILVRGPLAERGERHLQSLLSPGDSRLLREERQ
jgi:hypothetical protein